MPRQNIQAAEVARGLRYLLSLSLLVFIRRQFGARVLLDLVIAGGAFWFCLWLYKTCRVALFPLLPEPVLAPALLKLMFVLIAFHSLCVCFRRIPGEVHSYSTGRPLAFWGDLRLSESVVRLFIEPILGLGIAFGISNFDGLAAFWIYAAAVAAFIEEQLSRVQEKTRVLDAVDSRIESQLLHRAIQRRLTPASKSEPASSVVELPKPVRSANANAADIVEGLDPDLKSMIESSNSASERQSQ